jgi:hypothetical protein
MPVGLVQRGRYYLIEKVTCSRHDIAGKLMNWHKQQSLIHNPADNVITGDSTIIHNSQRTEIMCSFIGSITLKVI